MIVEVHEMPRKFVIIRKAIVALVPVLLLASVAYPENILEVIRYQSSVSSDKAGPLDLEAEIHYDKERPHAPIAVVMHGFRGDASIVREQAGRLRDAGFFAIAVSMRGRGNCDGKRDDGGVEIYDIYDAIEHVKNRYSRYIDGSNVHIVGYSGGGGNVMSALTKFPDYFRVGAAHFGISDYGYDVTYGWFFNGAGPTGVHHDLLVADIGDPSLGDPNVRDRYHARASSLASKNNPYSEIHLFVDYNETTCPPNLTTIYRDNAVSQASYPGEFNNITVHIGGYGKYEDFNHNGIDEPNELQNWPHGYPPANQQHASEAWYLGRLLTGQILQPVLHDSGELFVAGFVKTKRFGLWLGDGQNAAGSLKYNLSAETKSFSLKILSNDKSITGTLTVDVSDTIGKQVIVLLNGLEKARYVPGEKSYTAKPIHDGDTLLLKEVNRTSEGAGGK
jgi:pimeloyl-ACP methyl ester carboxylesterase